MGNHNQIDAPDLKGDIATEMQRFREAPADDHPYGSWGGGSKSSGGRMGGGGGGGKQTERSKALDKAGVPKNSPLRYEKADRNTPLPLGPKAQAEAAKAAFPNAKPGDAKSPAAIKASNAKLKADSAAARKSADQSMKAVPRAEMQKQISNTNSDDIRSAMQASNGKRVEVTFYDKASIAGGPTAIQHTVRGTVTRVDSINPSNPLVTGMALDSGKLTFMVGVKGTTSVKSIASKR